MNTRYAYLARAAALVATVLLTQLAVAQTARVQLVNASVDPMMETVDVYLDDVLWYDDFEYATAQAFADVLAGTRQVALAPPSSVSSAEAFKTLEMYLLSGQKYHAVLSGVMDPSQYEANPEGRDTSLNLFLGIGARETSSEPGKFETRAFHNLMTEGFLDFWLAIGSDKAFLVGGYSYGSFSPTYTQPPVSNSIEYLVRPDYLTAFYAEGEVGDLADKAFLEIALGFVGVEDCKVPPQGLQQLQWLRIFADGTIMKLDILCSPVGTEDVVEQPEMFRILGNYPNPFNPATTVEFDLSVSASVRVDIYDLLGRRVLQVPEQSFSAGPGQQIRIDASDLASGTYIYRVVARNGQTALVEGGHMTLLK